MYWAYSGYSFSHSARKVLAILSLSRFSFRSRSLDAWKKLLRDALQSLTKRNFSTVPMAMLT